MLYSVVGVLLTINIAPSPKALSLSPSLSLSICLSFSLSPNITTGTSYVNESPTIVGEILRVEPQHKPFFILGPYTFLEFTSTRNTQRLGDSDELAKLAQRSGRVASPPGLASQALSPTAFCEFLVLVSL